MWVVAIDAEYYYVLIGWGYLILEERDNPFIFLNKIPHMPFKKEGFVLHLM
jgi:hypothetical protein